MSARLFFQNQRKGDENQVSLIVKDTPYEIDKSVHEGERWVQVWTGSDCISPFDTIDEAMSFIEGLMEGKDHGV
jgi:hypothetical protein